MTMTRDRKTRTVTFDQRRYAQNVADQFDLRRKSAIPILSGMSPLLKGPQSDAEIEKIRDIP